jgi:non-specific serine/threonine protein kinase/serine/threonine-protein kinase
VSGAASWADAKRVFEAALDLPEAERAAFVEKACAGHAALLDEVRSLLTWHKGSTGFLETPPRAIGKTPDDGAVAARLVGKSIGAWRILDVIGSGGMGVVYRAERADAAFRRQAALKVVRTGPDLPQIMERFQLERETLAALDHPNIARLMDGGTTPDGQPFFVMELVDGEPIDVYCEERKLSINDRLDLFRKVCAGVQYAHENLVVHRDIKPDNILVTKDGVPKLLDFGVAKILSRDAAPEDPAATAATWMMTPDYASPEQVSGRPSTTATDVYSLGVLLHVLLTGARPYTLTGATPADIEKQLLAFTLIPPSQRAESSPEAERRALRRGLTAPKLARRLRGDLDAIVLRALGRTPASRYSSVEQLAEDVARHRANYPVHARGRTAGYATLRFVRRHRVALAVAALFAVVVVGGIVAVVRQASLAAEARTRAERRFNDVRRLAGSFIFDVYDAIDDVPGTTPARQLIVKNAVMYLESLAREAAGDTGLQRELAEAFVRVGDVQGNPTRANVGDPTGAIASYQRAIALAEAVRNAAPADTAVVRTLAGAHKQRGDVLALTGNKDAALADAEAAADLYAQIAGRDDATLDDKTASGVASIKLGDLLGNPNFENLGRTDSAVIAYRKALDSFRRLDQANPSSIPVRRFLGVTLERIGTMQAAAGQWSDAAASYQESFDIRRGLAEREPTHRDIQRDLGIAHEKQAEVLQGRGNATGAVAEQRQALAVYERLAAADPSDANAGRTVAVGRENVADALRKTGSVTEVLDLYRKALDVHRGFRAKDPHNVQAACDTARVAETLGDVLSAVEAPGACAAWRESQAARQSLPPSTGGCAAPPEVQRVTAKLGRC